MPLTIAAPDTLSSSKRRAVAVLFAAAVAGLGLQVVNDVAGGPAALGTAAYGVTLALAAALGVLRVAWIRHDRGAWIAFAAGLACWALSGPVYVWIEQTQRIPYPSVADALWLTSYVCFYVGIGLLVRGQVRGTRAAFWLDGVAVALGLATLAAAFVFGDLLRPMGGSPAAVVTNLAYPIGDLVLVGVVGGIFSVTAWRPGRVWGLLALGFLVLTGVDAVNLYFISDADYLYGNSVDVLWPAVMVVIAAAAWQRPGPGLEYESRGVAEILTPAVVSALSVTVLVLDNVVDMPIVAVGLAALSLLVVAVRAAITVLEVAALAVSRREALTDELTGLPNRRAFMRALDTAVRSGEPRALLLVDLDDFKEINDTLGHATGDAYLHRLGQRMAACVREGDLLCRLGGDEFALLTTRGDTASADAVAARLYNAVCGPVALPEVTVQLEGSIGVALLGEHAPDAPTLLRCADVAMYHAKDARTRWSFYAAEHDPHSPERLRIQAELRAAIEGGQLCLVFQPKASLADGSIADVEALVRWDHPTRGLLTPDQFLPMAERSGLMRDLTLAVLDLALGQAASWAARGTPLGVAVNLSPSSLGDDRLVFDVSDALYRHRVPARMLTLEVTESAMMADVPNAIEVLTELKRIGVSIALDDFGTGHASLAHLKHLPVDELKIDRGFVMQMASDSRDAAIVRLTVELARNLGLRVVAEGIEDAATWDELLLLGCDQAQGYYLSRPLAAGALAEFLSRPRAAGPPPAAPCRP